MSMRTWTVVALGLCVGGPALAEDAGTPKPAQKSTNTQPLVEAKALVPDLVEDLRYATEDNFLKKKVYPDTARCLLLPESALRLKKAAEVLRSKGYRLKVYDCYRPRAVQYEMWKIMPVPGYVADPKKGSNHNRGGAVDLTLVTMEGKDVEMPTPFDTFSKEAHHGYEGGTEASRKHREILREAMVGAGFTINRMEWWHYDLPDARKRPVLDVPFSAPQ
ncbi:D-alanyl-D-alanine dipeptidase [Pyxidicoccus fallax]|uniref:D-alanyl-D-alanine dipeptidase n=1 Tax=Pyxidicoccus fallax TaxID=394095 RepID=A0A848L8D3_9BACT|nr:D-alanyl-D-alanine dipeptidase [Pyxidicoccus fallax]NMO15260.1 D-alanyl-D-alanine dipeptidase [Pyxidicoccus fallax]NPC77627.1 D-alanyl-D-alanine dipeptidase [Pyxidicoccus fallax]